jgi:hypothetical protein
MIQATLSNPVFVGAANTVAPYFCTKNCSTLLSLWPLSTADVNSLRIRLE